MNKIYNNSALTPLKRVVLCPPTYFNFEPINVITEDWLEKGESADVEAFKREHSELARAYEENGVEVIMMEPTPGLPYEVYARDFGAAVAEGVVMGRFREPCRTGESEKYEAKLKELGVPIVARCTSGAFEGGDFWFLDEYTIAQGIVARTDWDGFANVRRQLEEKDTRLWAFPVGETICISTCASTSLPRTWPSLARRRCPIPSWQCWTDEDLP